MTLEEFKNTIETQETIMVYFSGESCGVCQALKPKIKETFSKHFPNIKQLYIDAQENPKISANYNVFALPTIFVYFEGREFFQKSRLISIEETKKAILRPYNLFYSKD